MLNLQPYQNPTYFGYLAVALLPIMIGILYGRRFRWYETLVTLAFLVLTFGGDKWWQGLMLICYIIYEMILTFGYFNYRKKKNSRGGRHRPRRCGCRCCSRSLGSA